jgi:hypothetical protein
MPATMTSSSGSCVAGREEAQGMARQPSEPAIPGTRGWLDLRVDHDEHGRIEHAGLYRYIGTVGGLYAFAPATAEPAVYLHPAEVVSFDPRPGASG